MIDMLSDVLDQSTGAEFPLVTSEDLQRIAEASRRQVQQAQIRFDRELQELRALAVPNALVPRLPLTDQEEQDIARLSKETPEERRVREAAEEVESVMEKIRLEQKELQRLNTTLVGGVSLYEQRLQAKIKAQERLVPIQSRDLPVMFQ